MYGEIDKDKYPRGYIFRDRRHCSEAGYHAPLIQGIHGDASAAAYSIVLSGGYEDDDDQGDIM